MTTLQLANSFSNLGGPHEIHTDGFTVLAIDEKGSLIRLDQNFSHNPLAIKDTVVYAAIPRNQDVLKAIRVATKEDRYKKYSRPEHLDALVLKCCDHPARYLSIQDDQTGRFFNLNVSADEARKHKQGDLYYYFFCELCGTTHTLPVDDDSNTSFLQKIKNYFQ